MGMFGKKKKKQEETMEQKKVEIDSTQPTEAPVEQTSFAGLDNGMSMSMENGGMSSANGMNNPFMYNGGNSMPGNGNMYGGFSQQPQQSMMPQGAMSAGMSGMSAQGTMSGMPQGWQQVNMDNGNGMQMPPNWNMNMSDFNGGYQQPSPTMNPSGFDNMMSTPTMDTTKNSMGPEMSFDDFKAQQQPKQPMGYGVSYGLEGQNTSSRSTAGFNVPGFAPSTSVEEEKTTPKVDVETSGTNTSFPYSTGTATSFAPTMEASTPTMETPKTEDEIAKEMADWKHMNWNYNSTSPVTAPMSETEVPVVEQQPVIQTPNMYDEAKPALSVATPTQTPQAVEIPSYEDVAIQPEKMDMKDFEEIYNSKDNEQTPYYEQKTNESAPKLERAPENGKRFKSRKEKEAYEAEQKAKEDKERIRKEKEAKERAEHPALNCSKEAEAYLMYDLMKSLNKGNTGMFKQRHDLAKVQLENLVKCGYDLERLYQNVKQNHTH